MIEKPVSMLVVCSILAWMDFGIFVASVVLLIAAAVLGVYAAIRLYIDKVNQRQGSLSKEKRARRVDHQEQVN
jgi:hypothetical protein